MPLEHDAVSSIVKLYYKLEVISKGDTTAREADLVMAGTGSKITYIRWGCRLYSTI